MKDNFYRLVVTGNLICPGCHNAMNYYEQTEDDNLWCCHNEHCQLETFEPDYAMWWPLSWPKYAMKRLVNRVKSLKRRWQS